MGASVKIDWNTVAANAIQAISLPANLSKVVSVKATVGTSFSASASIQDSFLLGFAKAGNKIAIEIRKADRRQFAVGVTLGLDVLITLTGDAKAELKRLETSILQQIIGANLKKVEGLIGIQKRYEDLDRFQKKLADSLSKIFFGKPVSELPLGLSDLQKKIDAWLKKSRKEIIKAAKQTIKAGLTIGYTRVKSDELLMKISVTADQLRPLHQDLIRGNMVAIQDPSLASSSSYFLRKISDQKRYTFSIGIEFGAIGLSYKRKKEASVIEESDRVGNKKLTFTYESANSGRVGNESNNRSLSITGEMEGYQAPSALMPSDLKYSLVLSVGNVDKKVNDDEAIDYVDTARLWGCIPSDLGTLKKVSQKISDGGTADILTSLRCSAEGAKQLLVWDKSIDMDLFAKALSLSLTGYRRFDELKDLEERERIYEPLFRAYLSLNEKNPGMRRRRKLIRELHDTLPEGPVKDAEEGFRLPGIHGGRRLPDDMAHWKQFASGFLYKSFNSKNAILGVFKNVAALNSSKRSYSQPDKFKALIWDTYSEVDVIRKNSIHMRALGSFLSLKANALGLSMENQFLIKSDSNKKTTVVSVPKR